jgi:hypothetical protein
MLVAERQKYAVAVADSTPAPDTGSNEQSQVLLRPAYENLYLFARLRRRSAADMRISWTDRLRKRVTMPRLRWRFR